MSQSFRANLLLLGLLIVSAAFLFIAYLAARSLGLLAHEQRYLMAGAGVVAIIANYLIARRMMRRVLTGSNGSNERR